MIAVRDSGTFTVTRAGFGLLQQVRELGRVHFDDFNYGHVDRMLGRMRLTLEIGLGDDAGPVIDYGQVLVQKDEVVGLMLVGSQLGHQRRFPIDFNFRLWLTTVRQLGAAIDYA